MMKVGVPKWIIQTKPGRKSLNKRTGASQVKVTNDCLFYAQDEANNKLKMMYPGYVVNRRSRNISAMGSHILW